MAEGIDFVSPVTTAGGLYPALNTQIAQTAMPLMVARQFYQQYSLAGIKTNTITFPKQIGQTSTVFSQVEGGALISQDMTSYDYVNARPYKIGQGYMVTRELIEDSMLPVVQDQLMRKALVLGNTVDKDCVNTLISSVLAANTVNGTGNTLFFDGTVTAIATTLGTHDIINAMVAVEGNNYEPNALFVSPKVLGDLRKLPHFHAMHYTGEQPAAILHGEVGEVMGLRVFKSNNCKTSAGSHRAFVLSMGITSNVLAQYSPMGFFVEKRPITTQVEEVGERDSQAVYMTMRYVPVVLRAETYAMVDTLG